MVYPMLDLCFFQIYHEGYDFRPSASRVDGAGQHESFGAPRWGKEEIGGKAHKETLAASAKEVHPT